MSRGRAKTPAMMTAAQARGLRVGDEVFVIRLWNATEPPRNRVPRPTRVVSTRPDPRTPGGVLVTVETSCGGRIELDSGWLEAPELEGPL